MKGNFLVLDVETTGLHADKYEVLEIYAQAMDTGGRLIGLPFYNRMRATKEMDPHAIARNGYTALVQSVWYDAVTQDACWHGFNEVFQGERLTLLGWNSPFDHRFVSPHVKDFNLSFHSMDIASMCLPWTKDVDPKRIYRGMPGNQGADRNNISLEDAVRLMLPKLGFRFHTAAGDVAACIALYKYVTNFVDVNHRWL